MSPELLEEKVLFLSARERLRLAAWLAQYEQPPKGINGGRWLQLQDGSTDYISHKELAALMDYIYPLGMALDVLRGNVTITREEVDA